MTTNKFKFRFKITGLELEVEGTKEDVASVTSNLSTQLKGLIQHQGIMTEPDSYSEAIESADIKESSDTIKIGTSRKKTSRKGKSIKSVITKEESPTISFRNDPSKYGTPSQEWSALQKALWILYVVQNELSISELTVSQITDSFNRHFKQTRTIRASNVSRDFGRNKLGPKHLVGEDVTSFPAKWYLSEEGVKYVQNLIKEQKS